MLALSATSSAQSFDVWGFSCDCTGDGYYCKVFYNNWLGEDAMVLFLFVDGTGRVVKSSVTRAPQGSSAVGIIFLCSLVQPGTYKVYWKAYKESDKSLSQPVAWAKSYEVQTLTCPCGGAQQPPILTLSDPEIQGLTVTVNGVAMPGTPGATITRIHWDWGDGYREDRGFAASHTYSSPGTYTLTVTAFQSDGLSTSKTKTITVTLAGRRKVRIHVYAIDDVNRMQTYWIDTVSKIAGAQIRVDSPKGSVVLTTTSTFPGPYVEVDENSTITVSLVAEPPGWRFTSYWDIFGVNWAPGPTRTFNVGTTDKHVAAAFTRIGGSHGSLGIFDLDYRGTPPNSDGNDQHLVTVAPGAILTLFFRYNEGNAGNQYIIRVYPEWNKNRAIANSDNDETTSEIGQEIGGYRWDKETYTVPTMPGTYQVRVVYSASTTPPTWDRYDRLLSEGTVVVQQRAETRIGTELSISIEPHIAPENKQTTVLVKGVLLRRDTRQGVANNPVVVSFRGQQRTITTDSRGFFQAEFTVNLPAGSYTFTASFAGDSQFEPSTTTATLTVLRLEFLIPTKLTLEIDRASIQAHTLETVRFRGKLIRTDTGQGLAGKTVYITIPGESVPVPVTTDAAGVYGLVYGVKVPAGTHTVEARYQGETINTTRYEASSATATLTATAVVQRVEITGLSTNKNSYSPGEQVIVTVKVKNMGGGAVAGLRINVDIADPSGKNVKTDVFQDGIRLEVNEEKIFTKTYWTVHSNAVAGTYTITAGLHGVPYVEKKITFSVTSLVIQKAEIISLSTNKDIYSFNEPVMVTVKVKNTGKIAISDLRININIVNPWGGVVKAGVFQDRINLAIGEEKTFTKTYWTVPPNAAMGIYTLNASLYNVSPSEKTATFRVGSNKVATRLSLELPPVITGKRITFIGNLTSALGTGLSGMVIKIYDRDTLLATGVTDQQGRFSITWEARRVSNEDDVEIYAIFEGTESYEKARFPETGYYPIRIHPHVEAFNFRFSFPPSRVVFKGAKSTIFAIVESYFKPDPPVDMPTVSLYIKGLPEEAYKLEPKSGQPLTIVWPVPVAAFITELLIDTEHLAVGDYQYTFIGQSVGLEVRATGVLHVVEKSEIGLKYAIYDFLSLQILPDFWSYSADVEFLKKGTDVYGFFLYQLSQILPNEIPKDPVSAIKFIIDFTKNVLTQIHHLVAYLEKLKIGNLLAESAKISGIDPQNIYHSLQMIPKLIQSRDLLQARALCRSVLGDVSRWRIQMERLTNFDSNVRKAGISVLSALELFLNWELEKGLTLSLGENTIEETTATHSADLTGQVINDATMLKPSDRWISRKSVSQPSGASYQSSDGMKLSVENIVLDQNPVKSPGAVTLQAKGTGIVGLKVEVFDLAGMKVLEQETIGDTMTFYAVDNKGHPLANGVYLCVVTVKGCGGYAIRSEIKKLVVLR
ncbi:MAG: PKD domain-containing protein [Candidatus Bathyarchaeia archaeon]